jgi:hypothetical protein
MHPGDKINFHGKFVLDKAASKLREVNDRDNHAVNLGINVLFLVEILKSSQEPGFPPLPGSLLLYCKNNKS